MIFQVDDQEADIIMKSLMQQPWHVANNLINKLMAQANAQANAKVPLAPPGNGATPVHKAPEAAAPAATQ